MDSYHRSKLRSPLIQQATVSQQVAQSRAWIVRSLLQAREVEVRVGEGRIQVQGIPVRVHRLRLAIHVLEEHAEVEK